jgi:hypothetical protein
MTNSIILVKELFSKTDSKDSKEIIKFSRTLVTPNKPCKTFKEAIKTLLNSYCNFSRREIQVLTF